jgi:hypothetical protein
MKIIIFYLMSEEIHRISIIRDKTINKDIEDSIKSIRKN